MERYAKSHMTGMLEELRKMAAAQDKLLFYFISMALAHSLDLDTGRVTPESELHGEEQRGEVAAA